MRAGVVDSAFIKDMVQQSFRQWASLSAATRNRKYACLKAFFAWLFQNGVIREDLQAWIKLPRVPERVPHYLSVDEVLYLIKEVAKRAGEKEKDRDLLLILLLYGGGLRVSEASFMRWEQVDLEGGSIRVMGKGGKERLVALPEMVLKELHRCRNCKHREYRHLGGVRKGMGFAAGLQQSQMGNKVASGKKLVFGSKRRGFEAGSEGGSF